MLCCRPSQPVQAAVYLKSRASSAICDVLWRQSLCLHVINTLRTHITAHPIPYSARDEYSYVILTAPSASDTGRFLLKSSI